MASHHDHKSHILHKPDYCHTHYGDSHTPHNSHKPDSYHDHEPHTSAHTPHLSDRGKRTLPILRPILDHTEPPIYRSPDHGAPLAGEINLQTAENWLLRPDLLPKFQGYIQNNFTAQDLSYVSGKGGASDLLSGLSAYFNNYFQPVIKVEPEHLVTAPGASHLLDTVFWHLYNPSEGVLISTPYWPGFDEALKLRNSVVPVKVDIPFDNPEVDFYGPETVEYYKQAIKDSKLKVTGLVICNPHNPVAGCYPKETLEALFKFAQEYDLKVVVDELYGLSVFDESDKFVSALSINLEQINVDKHRVHVVYSFSKDLNSSGIRLGIFITQNHPDLREAVAESQQSKLSSFTSIAGIGLLQDLELVSFVVKENPKRLAVNYAVLKNFLSFHKIEYIKPTAGLYAFINFLASAQEKITEDQLDKRFREAGVRLNAGTSLHSTKTGWFRLVFAVPKATLESGLLKIQFVLGLSGWTPPAEKN